MTKIKLDYIHEFRDRHGKTRRYFRRHGRRVALPGAPGSEEFNAAYQAAMAGQGPPTLIGASRTKPGTVAAVVAGYFQSMAFRSLSASTQATYRGILDNFRAQHGDKRVAMLERRHIDRMLADKAETPAAANNLLRMLRTLMQWCVAEGLRRDDATAGLKAVATRTDGFLIWSEDQVAGYRARHALGTRARLALELLVNTGQRRSDVVRMGRQHVRDGILSIRQQKTGTLVEIPVLPELVAAIEAMPTSDHLTYLTTENGKPFTAAGFGNWFRECCNEAGIAKGLRRARPAQGSGDPPRQPRRDGARAHGMVRVEDAQGSRALHASCRSQAAGRRHGGEARNANSDWQTRVTGLPNRGLTT